MGKKAPRRWYSCLMIIMCIRLVLQAAISFRAAPKAVHIMFSQFEAVKDQLVPTAKSVSRWLTQIGLYKLRCLKEQGTDWALIVDNSVQIGTQKCLVILGVRLSKLKSKALTFEDVETLGIELHNETSPNTVCQALERAQKRVGKVAMVCADDGPDLRGGVALFCKQYGAGRVFDIIHKIGTFLKKIFENDPEWQAFSTEAAEAKKKMQQTVAAHLSPPNQRTKSRFLNIEPLARWGIDGLNVIETPSHPDKMLLEEYCPWLLKYKKLIERLRQFDLISRETRQYVRENGLSAKSGEQLENTLDTLTKLAGFNLEACQYAGQLIDFVVEQSKIVPSGEVWIASSEIIESLFGKLKCLERDQSKGGFTSLILGIAACVGTLDADVIMAAMSQVKTKDVDAWTREHIGMTVLAKRRKALGLWRKKKPMHLIENPCIVQEPSGIYTEKVMGF